MVGSVCLRRTASVFLIEPEHPRSLLRSEQISQPWHHSDRVSLDSRNRLVESIP